jgi:hypothetical protein
MRLQVCQASLPKAETLNPKPDKLLHKQGCELQWKPPEHYTLNTTP